MTLTQMQSKPLTWKIGACNQPLRRAHDMQWYEQRATDTKYSWNLGTLRMNGLQAHWLVMNAESECCNQQEVVSQPGSTIDTAGNIQAATACLLVNMCLCQWMHGIRCHESYTVAFGSTSGCRQDWRPHINQRNIHVKWATYPHTLP